MPVLTVGKECRLTLFNAQYVKGGFIGRAVVYGGDLSLVVDS